MRWNEMDWLSDIKGTYSGEFRSMPSWVRS